MEITGFNVNTAGRARMLMPLNPLSLLVAGFLLGQKRRGAGISVSMCSGKASRLFILYG